MYHFLGFAKPNKLNKTLKQPSMSFTFPHAMCSLVKKSDFSIPSAHTQHFPNTI